MTRDRDRTRRQPGTISLIITPPPPSQGPSAEASLEAHGAQLVLTAGKRPIWKGWPKRWPTAAQAEHHRAAGGVLGVVPHTLGATVVDIDRGDPKQLLLRLGTPPWAALKTLRDDGWHWWFDDAERRRNSSWFLDGCQGDIRSASGFVCLHVDAPELLAEALELRVVGQSPFPVELLGRELGPSARGQAGADQDRSQLGEPPLEHVLEGARQKALFSVLSRWAFAYRQQNKVGSDWPARVLTEALDQKRALP